MHIMILNDAQHAAAKAAIAELGSAAEHVALSEAQKAVAVLKTTPVGVAAVDAVNSMAATDKTGPEKLEGAVAAVAPAVLDYVQKGGVKAVLADVESVGRELVQSTFDDIKSASAGSIASAVLKIAGVVAAVV